jgi:hypothetical protein
VSLVRLATYLPCIPDDGGTLLTPTAAKQRRRKAIKLYNNERPHLSIENFTPNQLHNNPRQIKKRLWKNYYKKLNNFKQNYPVNVLQDLS